MNVSPSLASSCRFPPLNQKQSETSHSSGICVPVASDRNRADDHFCCLRSRNPKTLSQKLRSVSFSFRQTLPPAGGRWAGQHDASLPFLYGLVILGSMWINPNWSFTNGFIPASEPGQNRTRRSRGEPSDLTTQLWFKICVKIWSLSLLWQK